jgi:hypothetical protein
MARTACLVCFISSVTGFSKKNENALEDVALVAGRQQNLSVLYSLDIYGWNTKKSELNVYGGASKLQDCKLAGDHKKRMKKKKKNEK